MAGRIVLIKSSLNGLPNYWFSLHKVPKNTVKEVEGNQKEFFMYKYQRSRIFQENNVPYKVGSNLL